MSSPQHRSISWHWDCPILAACRRKTRPLIKFHTRLKWLNVLPFFLAILCTRLKNFVAYEHLWREGFKTRQKNVLKYSLYLVVQSIVHSLWWSKSGLVLWSLTDMPFIPVWMFLPLETYRMNTLQSGQRAQTWQETSPKSMA